MTDAHDDPLTADIVAVGDEGPELIISDLERRDFVKYAGASGDFHEVHYSEPFATDAGNPSVFAQGMLTGGFAANMVADWFGLANVTGLGMRFQARVFPGDTVIVTGEITDVIATEDGADVEADFVATNGDEEIVLSGDASASLPASE